MKKIEIRAYQPADCAVLAELFYQTVHTVNAGDYTEEQLNAWADGNVDLAAWDSSLSAHFSVVALQNGKIVGFGDIDHGGYLDRLYVHKDYQRQGVGGAICDELEQAVAEDKITTFASITAKPFFENRGYRVVRENLAVRHGITLKNYLMEKRL